jgi:hypothetical protein
MTPKECPNCKRELEDLQHQIELPNKTILEHYYCECGMVVMVTTYWPYRDETDRTIHIVGNTQVDLWSR